MHFSESRTSLNLAKPKLNGISCKAFLTDECGMNNLPLAGTSASVNDGLALLDLTEARGILRQKIIVSGGMKSANVDVLVAIDAVVEALLKGLPLLGGSEDSRDSGRDRRILLDKGTKLSLSDTLALGSDGSDHARHSKLLGRGSRVARAISRNDPRSIMAVRHGAKEGSAWRGFGSCG